jgi:DNA-binding response OmpR family regulator
MYTQKFNLEGFDTEISYDGEDALTKAQENRYDIILLDLMLPKLSGLDMLERFIESENGKVTPVIALTNLADPRERQRAFNLGVKDYLVKAMQTPEEVVNIIKHHAGRNGDSAQYVQVN